LNCRSCGEVVDPRRVELGYDYCLKPECQQRCMKRVNLASVGVNKAADYYTTADELLPPPAPAPLPVAEEENGPTAGSHPAPAPKPTKAGPSTLARLRQYEAELDTNIAAWYERFRSGEITAREMERECDQLVAAFNQRVMSENIRYRSMLRKRRQTTSR
jgi:hypothetical protein